MFMMERTKHDAIALADAPEVTWRWNFPRPKLSRWKPDSWNDLVIAMVKDDKWQEAAEKREMPGYGYWSANGNFQLQRSWVSIEEEEGLGRGDDDAFQEEAAENCHESRWLCARKRRQREAANQQQQVSAFD